MLDFDFSVEHVLMFMIVIFLLYHLVNSCGYCNNSQNKENFSISSQNKHNKDRRQRLENEITELENEITELKNTELKNKKTSEYIWDNNKEGCKIWSDPKSCIKNDNYCVDLSSRYCPLNRNSKPAFNEDNCESSGDYVWCGKKKSIDIPCTDIDDCSGNGTASGFRDNCNCSCNSGYTGSKCETKSINIPCTDIDDCSGNGTAKGFKDNCNCSCNPGYTGSKCEIKDENICNDEKLFINKGINCDDVSSDNPPDMVWLNNQKWYNKCIPGQKDNKINYVRTVHYRNSYDFNPISNLFITKDSSSYWSPPKYSREWVEFLLRNNIKVTIGITVLSIDNEIWETKWQLNQLVDDIKRWNLEPEKINKNIVCINIGNEPNHQDTWKNVLLGLEYAQNLKKAEPLLKDIPISFVENWYELFDNYGFEDHSYPMIDYKFHKHALKSFELIDTLSLNIYPYYACVSGHFSPTRYKCNPYNIFDFILYNSSGNIDKNYQLYSPIYSLIVMKYHIKELMKNNQKIKIDLDKTIISETGWPYDETDDTSSFMKDMTNKEIYKRVYDDIISFNKEKISMNIDGKLYEYKSPNIIHYFTINNATDYDKKTDKVIQQHFGANVLLSDSDKKLLDNNKNLIEKINKLSRGNHGINTEIYNNKSLQDQLKNTNKALKCFQDNIMDLQNKKDISKPNAYTLISNTIDKLSMCPQVNYSDADDINSSVCNIKNLNATGNINTITNRIYNYEYDTLDDIYKRKTGQTDDDSNLQYIKNKYNNIKEYYYEPDMSTKNEYLCNELNIESELNTCNRVDDICYTTNPNKINSIISDGKNSKIYKGICKFKSDTCSMNKDESKCNIQDNCNWNIDNNTCNQIKNQCKGNEIKTECDSIKIDYICNNSYINNGNFNQCEFKQNKCVKSDTCISNKNFIDTKKYILLKTDNIYRISEKNKNFNVFKPFNLNYETSKIILTNSLLISKDKEFLSEHVDDIIIEKSKTHIKMNINNILMGISKIFNMNGKNIISLLSIPKYIWIIYYDHQNKVDKCSETSLDVCDNSYKLNSVNSEYDTNEVINADGDYIYNCLVNDNKCIPNNKNINMYNYNICPSYTNFATNDGTNCNLDEENCNSGYTKINEDNYTCKWDKNKCLVNKNIDGKCNDLNNPMIKKYGDLFCDINN